MLWHADPLLDKDHKATIQQPLPSNGSANKHISKETREYSNNGKDIFYAVHAKMLQAGSISSCS
jgi:hypothetical protein